MFLVNLEIWRCMCGTSHFTHAIYLKLNYFLNTEEKFVIQEYIAFNKRITKSYFFDTRIIRLVMFYKMLKNEIISMSAGDIKIILDELNRQIYALNNE